MTMNTLNFSNVVTVEVSRKYHLSEKYGYSKSITITDAKGQRFSITLFADSTDSLKIIDKIRTYKE